MAPMKKGGQARRKLRASPRFFSSLSCGRFEVARQLVAADWVLEFGQRGGFNLSDALARDLEDAADLFERVAVAVAEPVTEPDDLALAVG